MASSARCVACVDDQFRRPEIHAPTIGILLCTGKTGPIAVADYHGLSAGARGALPSGAELDAVFEDELVDRTDGRNPLLARANAAPMGRIRSADKVRYVMLWPFRRFHWRCSLPSPDQA